MTRATSDPLVTRRLLRPRTLVYFYRRRLRAHGMQELLAGVGIAAAVALVLAAGVAQSSIAGSARGVLHAVIGPADLQLRARGPGGFNEALLSRVEALPGVRRAAPLLERSFNVIGPGGARANIYIAGTDTSLAVLNGLGRTLPLNTLTAGAVGLSATSAHALGLDAQPARAQAHVTLLIGGVKHTLPVSQVLGREAVGALAQARVGVMPLGTMQQLLAQPGTVTRILVQSAPGEHAAVARGLRTLAGGRLIAGGTEEDIAQLDQALRPSGQASELFAVIGALLGLLFAFNAIMLTVPERRQAIADLRLSGTRGSAIVQLVSFQALCLGVCATAVGLAVGYALSRWVFHQSTGYLSEAFTLSGGTVVASGTVLLAGLGGVIVTWLASALPLADLRGGAAPDSIYLSEDMAASPLGYHLRRVLSATALGLFALATVLYATAPSSALVASAALALATMLVVPVTFACALALARALSQRAPRMATLALALGGLRGTSLRALALAATGAVALFGGVALGGARSDLLSGIRGFARGYADDAAIWVGEPGDNQATQQLAGDGGAARVAGLPGVASVQRLQGAFLAIGSRRAWVLARAPGGARSVLATQTLGGPAAAAVADARLAQGGWVAVSQQIASERHVRVDGTLTLATPSGEETYRVAALTSNLAWSPGVVFMSSADFTRAWSSAAPSALGVQVVPGASVAGVKAEIVRALGPDSGVEVAAAATREARIDALTSEGLSQLGLISTLLVLAAIVALAAALASSIHQRRIALAGLRLSGAPSARLRRILLIEGALTLGAGCLTGALVGIYGQVVIDAYLRHITGFPVAGAGASLRPLVLLAVVLVAALALVVIPGWRASRVAPGLALAQE